MKRVLAWGLTAGVAVAITVIVYVRFAPRRPSAITID